MQKFDSERSPTLPWPQTISNSRYIAENVVYQHGPANYMEYIWIESRSGRLGYVKKMIQLTRRNATYGETNHNARHFGDTSMR